jgi:hypothetical protein
MIRQTSCSRDDLSALASVNAARRSNRRSLFAGSSSRATEISLADEDSPPSESQRQHYPPRIQGGLSTADLQPIHYEYGPKQPPKSTARDTNSDRRNCWKSVPSVSALIDVRLRGRAEFRINVATDGVTPHELWAPHVRRNVEAEPTATTCNASSGDEGGPAIPRRPAEVFSPGPP